MKKLSKILITMIIAAVLLCASLVPALGAVNGKEAEVGSTVEYSLCISDAVQTITGIHLEFFFDQDVLELKDVNTDNLPNSTVNANNNKDGSVKIVNGLINGAQGLACSEKTELAKLTFEVIGEGDADIKYYIPYMYDYDVVNLYDYTLSQTITIDNQTVVEDIPPVLADDSDYGHIEKFDKGDFANNEEGTGSGIKPEPTTAKSVAADAEADNGGNSTVIIACICVAVIVGAVVVLVVAKSKAGKSENQNWE
ncbi:MAG: hypothetical protein IJA62_06485 [Ruminococcus sp.]|nr:hypothetical protein [Ruminococcus sp.]